MRKRLKVPLLISGGVAILVLFLWFVGGFASLDSVLYDFKFKIRGHLKPDKDIVIVAIDEKSIEKLGRWPWPRRVHARLIDILVQKGAKVVIFDVLFTEFDKSDPLSDKVFHQVVKRSRRTVLGCFFHISQDGSPAKILLPIYEKLGSNRVGFVNIFPEMDGVCRRLPLMREFKGREIPSLSLAGLAIYYNKTPSEIIAEKKIVLDVNDEMLINYRGGFEMFDYISYADVIDGKIPKEKIKDKIVLVGGTATGLFDFKPIPYAPVFPGVEIHANAISNIINGNFLRPVSGVWAFLMVLIFCAASGFYLAKLGAWGGSVFAFLVLFGYLFFSYLLFLKNFSFSYIAPIVTVILCYIGIVVYRFFTEEKEKKHIKKTFSYYLSPHVMNEVLSDPSRLKLGGEKQFLTVLFSDIRGFTTISENLKPEEVVCLLNEYLTEMVKVIFKYDGTLDKFMGDAIMAFWGAPIPQNDHALRGVSAAIDMIKSLKVLQSKWRSEGKSVLEVGIGVNTGDMVVGNMGSLDRMDYTVIGDNVNLASRLEGLTKEYDTQIIISEYTYNIVKEQIETKYLGEVKIKGKAKPVKIYSVVVPV